MASEKGDGDIDRIVTIKPIASTSAPGPRRVTCRAERPPAVPPLRVSVQGVFREPPPMIERYAGVGWDRERERWRRFAR